MGRGSGAAAAFHITTTVESEGRTFEPVNLYHRAAIEILLFTEEQLKDPAMRLLDTAKQEQRDAIGQAQNANRDDEDPDESGTDRADDAEKAPEPEEAGTPKTTEEAEPAEGRRRSTGAEPSRGSDPIRSDRGTPTTRKPSEPQEIRRAGRRVTGARGREVADDACGGERRAPKRYETPVRRETGEDRWRRTGATIRHRASWRPTWSRTAEVVDAEQGWTS